MQRGICLFVLAGLAATEPAAAQGFGWLFGEPPVRHVARTRRPIAMPADVPLPVPRPHFVDGAAMPAKTAQGLPAAAPQVAASAAPSPPLPPERPPLAEPAPSAAPPATPPAREAETAMTGVTSAPPAPQAEAAEVPPETAPLPPEKPAVLATAPAPAVAASGATTALTPREPTADPTCAERLKARGVYTEPVTLGPQPDARCTVVQPLRLVAATLEDKSVVSFPDKPTIACTTADAFSAYVHDLLAPLAKGTWGVPVTAVWTGPGLECRSRDHIFGAKLSAHGQGLAVDIARLKLADGRTIAVGEPTTDAERDFEMAARAGGCGYFHTVLGPGSDAYHRTHWHLDLEVRGKDGDGKYCK